MSGQARRITDAQRRERLGRRHHLAAGAAAGPVAVARDLVALHSTDAATVYLAVAARSGGVTPEAVERALYEDRSLIRMLAMRRTVFVVPVELAPAVQVAASRAVAARARKSLVKQLVDAGVPGDGTATAAEWLVGLEASVHRALLARGEAMAAELSADEPRLRTQIGEYGEKAYQVPQAITSRVLNLMSADGLIVRGRPRGSWTSTQYRWSPVERWVPGGLPEVSPADAGAALARAYLAAYGPATIADLRWWTGWTVAETKRALAEVDRVEVALDSGDTGLVLPDDLDAPPARTNKADDDRAVLLPALDPSLMGWADRSFFLGDHGPALFDRNGNAAPTVWWDGRIIGGWAQRAGGEIAWRLLEDAGSAATAAVEAAAGRLAAWLGPVRLAPRARGRPPLEQELIS